jgi:mannose-1-phosphate guanylyltransferase
MMIAIEEAVKVMTTHIKTNSTIQTFGISAAGPVTGYGQIQ